MLQSSGGPQATGPVSPEFYRQIAIAKVCVYGLSILSASLFLMLPLFNLLHPSPWQRWMGAVHGFAALLATVVMVYAEHLAFPLKSLTLQGQ